MRIANEFQAPHVQNMIVRKTVQEAYDTLSYVMNDMVIIRPIYIDGNGVMVTNEFNPNRINVEIKGGYITKVFDIG